VRDDDHYDRTCGPDFEQILRKTFKEFTAEVGKASAEKLMDRLSTSESWDAYAAECADFAGRIVRYRRRSGRSDIPLGARSNVRRWSHPARYGRPSSDPTRPPEGLL
jgi:hypothetical protein